MALLRLWLLIRALVFTSLLMMLKAYFAWGLGILQIPSERRLVLRILACEVHFGLGCLRMGASIFYSRGGCPLHLISVVVVGDLVVEVF